MRPSSTTPGILPLLADTHRWQLLHELARSDRRVGELAERTGSPQNLVSYHLGALRKAGVVTARRSSADGRDVYYRADLLRCRALLAGAGAGLHPALQLVPATRDDEVPPTGSRVLFLCTGNSARSQMAEALLVHRSGGAVEARSAGSTPKPLRPMAVRVMAERDIDLRGHTSKSLDGFVAERFDRVITLCDKVREVCPELPGARDTAHWSTPDPAAADPADDEHDVFVRLADDLEVRISLLLAELTTALPERTAHAR